MEVGRAPVASSPSVPARPDPPPPRASTSAPIPPSSPPVSLSPSSPSAFVPSSFSASSKCPPLCFPPTKGGATRVRLTLTWTRTTYIVLKPNGRKCDCCKFTDHQDDPVSLQMKPPVKEQMWWGYPPYPDGTTQGTTCGYCKRIWTSRIKPQGVALASYKGSLGTDEKLLNVHTTMVTTVIDVIVLKGYVRNSQLDWEEVTTKTLKVVKVMETVVNRPGWQHLPWDYYTSLHGDFYANIAGQEAGHREFTFEGKRGVLIPDVPITKIKFNERIQGILEENVRTSDGKDTLSTDELDANLRGLAGTFSNVGKGSAASHGGLLSLGDSASGDLALLMGPRVWDLCQTT